MRPLSLTINGFRSYAGEQTFDFRDRRLVGVVGPIGSGKSSLLDAVSFALYGRTPTVKGNRTRSLINQRKDAAHVELWFEVEDQVWRAVRALRRRGQSAHTLTRHATSDGEGERLETVDQERAMTARVEELLGLDFHAFGRSVLLAQNQFARFLEATGRERDDVLKGVFGLDRLDAMHEAAKDRRDAARRDLEELERRRDQAASDQAALRQEERRLAEGRERLAALEEAKPAHDQIETALEAARRTEKEAEARARELRDFAVKLPRPKAAARLLSRAAAGEAALMESEETLAKAQGALAEAEEALADTVARTGDRETHARLQLLIQKAADRAEAAQKEEGRVEAVRQARVDATAALERATAVQREAEAIAAEASRALAAAGADREQAELALHEARHGSMAATLRAALAAGEPCPVCEQDVAAVPEAATPPDVAAAEGRLGAAKEAEAAAGHALKRAEKEQAEAGRKLAATEARWAEAAESLERSTAERNAAREEQRRAAGAVEKELGEGDAIQLLGDRIRLLDEAEERRHGAVAAEQEARRAVEEGRAGLEDHRAALQRLSTETATLAARLGSEIEAAPEPEVLRAALDRLVELWQAASSEAEDAGKEAARQREEAEAGRRRLFEEVDLAPETDFEEALQAARTLVAAATEKVDFLAERVARVAELEKENAATVARHATYQRLADDLTPSHFLRYLLEEERTALAALAGERFELLSGGRYRFSPDGAFDVVDLAAAEAVRAPGSLSGGEIFLASLALALALAEMVTREGGRLDAFFLDEGFGSLDPEHLDLAMDGIERLVADSGQRLVLVVSHVPELRHRLEDLIELGKDPVSGDTRVLRS